MRPIRTIPLISKVSRCADYNKKVVSPSLALQADQSEDIPINPESIHHSWADERRLTNLKASLGQVFLGFVLCESTSHVQTSPPILPSRKNPSLQDQMLSSEPRDEWKIESSFARTVKIA